MEASERRGKNARNIRHFRHKDAFWYSSSERGSLARNRVSRKVETYYGSRTEPGWIDRWRSNGINGRFVKDLVQNRRIRFTFYFEERRGRLKVKDLSRICETPARDRSARSEHRGVDADEITAPMNLYEPRFIGIIISRLSSPREGNGI